MNAPDLKTLISIFKSSLLFRIFFTVMLIFTLACPILDIVGNYLGSGGQGASSLTLEPSQVPNLPYLYYLGIYAYGLCILGWILLSILAYIKCKELIPAIIFCFLSVIYVIAISWVMQAMFYNTTVDYLHRKYSLHMPCAGDCGTFHPE